MLIPDLLNLIAEFVGPIEPETDDESSDEVFELPGDGSYPMAQVFAPAVKII